MNEYTNHAKLLTNYVQSSGVGRSNAQEVQQIFHKFFFFKSFFEAYCLLP